MDILEDSGMLCCKPSLFPIEQNLKLDRREEEAPVNSSQYCRLIGRHLYFQATRPNVKYVVNLLSQFVFDPRQSDMQGVTRVLRYLKDRMSRNSFTMHWRTYLNHLL